MTVMPRVNPFSVLDADTLNFAFAELENQGRACRVRRTSSLSIPSGTPTTVVWQAEDFDTNGGGMWQSGSDFSNAITIRVPGTYLLLAQVRWDDVGGEGSPYRLGLRNSFITVDGFDPDTSACRGNTSSDATRSLTGRGATTQTYAIESLDLDQRVHLVLEQDCGSTIVGCHQDYGGTFLSATRMSGRT